jgi:hypothetical protein
MIVKPCVKVPPACPSLLPSSLLPNVLVTASVMVRLGQSCSRSRKYRDPQRTATQSVKKVYPLLDAETGGTVAVVHGSAVSTLGR